MKTKRLRKHLAQDRERRNAPPIFAKKSLGQNFLMHASIAERIADASGITKKDTVLEIGPGTGMLTRVLLSRAKKVIAVEADNELVGALKESFKKELEAGHLELRSGDIRSCNLSTLPARYTLVANIPYYITGEILRMFLSGKHQPSSLTLLVQKEVAERITRSKKESLLSLSVKAYGNPAYRFTVPRGAFLPAPKVDSAVLSITDISRHHFKHKNQEERFFELLRAGFAHKRKLLISNLAQLVEKHRLVDIFERLHIPQNARAEDITLSLWLSLAKEKT